MQPALICIVSSGPQKIACISMYMCVSLGSCFCLCACVCEVRGRVLVPLWLLQNFPDFILPISEFLYCVLGTAGGGDSGGGGRDLPTCEL